MQKLPLDVDQTPERLGNEGHPMMDYYLMPSEQERTPNHSGIGPPRVPNILRYQISEF